MTRDDVDRSAGASLALRRTRHEGCSGHQARERQSTLGFPRGRDREIAANSIQNQSRSSLPDDSPHIRLRRD